MEGDNTEQRWLQQVAPAPTVTPTPAVALTT